MKIPIVLGIVGAGIIIGVGTAFWIVMQSTYATAGIDQTMIPFVISAFAIVAFFAAYLDDDV